MISRSTRSASGFWIALCGTLLLAASPAAAQVMLLEPGLEGELDDSQKSELQERLHAALDEALEVEVLTVEASREALGDAAACDNAECAAEAASTVRAQAFIYAYVYSASEIYDVRVVAFSGVDGAQLDEEITDCTFCPFNEAADSFAFSATTLATRLELPALPAVAEPEVVAEGSADTQPEETEPEVVATPEPPANVTAFETGDIELTIEAQPSNAEIRVNGQVVGQGRAVLSVAPQELAITIRASGREEFEREIVITGDDPQLTLMAELGQQGGGSPASFNRRAVGGILVGTGAAALIGGIVALAMDGNTTCSEGPTSACASVYETTALGVTLAAVGGIAAGTGVGFFITAGDSDAQASVPPPTRPTRFALVPRQGGAVFSFGGRF